MTNRRSSPSNPAEHAALPAYAFAAAMEFLGAVREDRLCGNRTSENLMIMQLGLLGLRQAAQMLPDGNHS